MKNKQSYATILSSFRESRPASINPLPDILSWFKNQLNQDSRVLGKKTCNKGNERFQKELNKHFLPFVVATAVVVVAAVVVVVAAVVVVATAVVVVFHFNKRTWIFFNLFSKKCKKLFSEEEEEKNHVFFSKTCSNRFFAKGIFVQEFQNIFVANFKPKYERP